MYVVMQKHINQIRVFPWSMDDIQRELEDTDAEIDEELLDRVYNDFVLEEDEVRGRKLEIWNNDMEDMIPPSVRDQVEEEYPGATVLIRSYTENTGEHPNNSHMNEYVDVVEVVDPNLDGEVLGTYRSEPYYD